VYTLNFIPVYISLTYIGLLHALFVTSYFWLKKIDLYILNFKKCSNMSIRCDIENSFALATIKRVSEFVNLVYLCGSTTNSLISALKPSISHPVLI